MVVCIICWYVYAVSSQCVSVNINMFVYLFSRFLTIVVGGGALYLSILVFELNKATI